MCTERAQEILGLLLAMCWCTISGQKFISRTISILPLNFIRVCVQYQFRTTSTVDGLRQRKDLNTKLIIKLEICQKQAFDIITMKPRGTLGLCFVHIDHPDN